VPLLLILLVLLLLLLLVLLLLVLVTSTSVTSTVLVLPPQPLLLLRVLLRAMCPTCLLVWEVVDLRSVWLRDVRRVGLGVEIDHSARRCSL